MKKFHSQNWGAEIEKDALFPQGINIEFVQKINPKEVRQRTWERGTGETWACGSGACAVCVAGFLSKRTENKIQIQLLAVIRNQLKTNKHNDCQRSAF